MGPKGALRQKVDRSETGPTRSRAKRVRPAPYARNQPSETTEDGSLLDRVKDIVGWLLPSWFTRDHEHVQVQVRETLHEKTQEYEDEHVQEYEGMRMQECKDNHLQEFEDGGVGMDTPEFSTEETGAIFRRLTMEREARMRLDTYADLAQYFRQKGEMLLTSEEYEHLALVIQRQAIGQVRSRRDFHTPSTVRRSPRLKTRRSMEEVPTMEEVEMSVIKEMPMRRAKVFSARFEDEGAWMAEKPGVPATPRISENRHRLIEEARNRVYEQIKQSRQESQGVKFEMPKLVEEPIKKSSLGTVVEKPAFSFTIPVTVPSIPTPVVEEAKPKLIFDFGTINAKPDVDKTKPVFTFEVPPSTPGTTKPVISFEPPSADPPKLSLSTIPEESSAKVTENSSAKPLAFDFGAVKPAGTTEAPSFTFSAVKPVGTKEAPSFTFGKSEVESKLFASGEGDSAPAFGEGNSAPAFGVGSSAPAFGLPSSTTALGLPSTTTASGAPSSTTTPGTSGSTAAFNLPSSTTALGVTKPTFTFGDQSSTAAPNLPNSTTVLNLPSSAPEFGASSPKSAAFATSSNTPFSFGAISPANNTDTKSTSGFSFGMKPAVDKPVFSFGSTSKSFGSDQTPSGEAKPTGFQFGTTPPKSEPSVAGESAPTSFFNLETPTKSTEKTQFGFSFGTGSTEPAFGAAPSTFGTGAMTSAFGATTPAVSFGNVSPTAGPSPSFGATPATGQTSSFGTTPAAGQTSSFGTTPTTGPTSFSFGASQPTQSTQQSGFGATTNSMDFNFGATPPPAFTFGSGAPPAFSAGTTQQQNSGPRKFSVPASRRRK